MDQGSVDFRNVIATLVEDCDAVEASFELPPVIADIAANEPGLFKLQNMFRYPAIGEDANGLDFYWASAQAALNDELKSYDNIIQ